VELSDGDVVRRVLDGEEEMYHILVERYRRQFGRYAASLLQDADAAEDAMQEAFIRAYRSLGSLRNPDGFGGWFYRILTNQCHNVRAARRPTMDVAKLNPQADDRTETAAERRELGEAIEDALDQLSDEQREAFVLKHVQGLSYDQMDELLGAGVDALKMRVYRARDRLREILGDRL
jgi:RNA polymerase sigma-70 factor (ECF subfamily)